MLENTKLTKISDLGLESRIKSFEFRRIQNKIYDEVNILTIKSLKAKLAGKFEESDSLHQQSIKKKEEARDMGNEASKHHERASRLDRVYYKALEMLGDDWEAHLDLSSKEIGE